jgi:hypothetical protein
LESPIPGWKSRTYIILNDDLKSEKGSGTGRESFNKTPDLFFFPPISFPSLVTRRILR